MFFGEYQHTLDAKGRMFVPAKFRDELGEKFIVTIGLDRCLLYFLWIHSWFIRKNWMPYHLQTVMQESLHASSLQGLASASLTNRVE